MTQYKSHVPQELKDKIEFFIHNLPHEKLMRRFHIEDGVSEHNIVPIQGNYLDGYIPHQDGGLEWNVLVDAACTKFISEHHKAFMGKFWEQYDQDFEDDEQPDPDLYQVQIYADSGEVTVRISLNYKDAPYYREKYAEDVVGVTFTHEEFMDLSVDGLVGELLA